MLCTTALYYYPPLTSSVEAAPPLSMRDTTTPLMMNCFVTNTLDRGCNSSNYSHCVKLLSSDHFQSLAHNLWMESGTVYDYEEELADPAPSIAAAPTLCVLGPMTSQSGTVTPVRKGATSLAIRSRASESVPKSTTVFPPSPSTPGRSVRMPGHP
jgi:hypothetical protein